MLRKALDYGHEKVMPKQGAHPTFDVPKGDGWTKTPDLSDTTSVCRAIRRTRDASDHDRWRTWYLMMVCAAEVKRMKTKLKRVLAKDARDSLKRKKRARR